MRISDWSSDVCSSDLLAGQLQPAEAVVEHFPLVRLAQAQRIGGEEDGGGHAARPVLGEGVHRLQLAAAQGVEELELAHQFVGAERLQGELARSLLDRSEEQPSELQSLMRNSYAV